MPNSATALRRWLGTFSLAVAFAMLTWGQTVLKPHLKGNLLLIYWLVFLVFTCSAVGISLFDFFALRRSVREDIATLKAKALQGIDPSVDPQKKAILRRKMGVFKRLETPGPSRKKGGSTPKTPRR